MVAVSWSKVSSHHVNISICSNDSIDMTHQSAQMPLQCTPAGHITSQMNFTSNATTESNVFNRWLDTHVSWTSGQQHQRAL
eukprot:2808682-Amphidinium_carterae.1